MTLSPRQREIVVLVGRDGKQYKTVARELGIKLCTLQSHIERITAKYPSNKQPRDVLIELYWCEVR